MPRPRTRIYFSRHKECQIAREAGGFSHHIRLQIGARFRSRLLFSRSVVVSLSFLFFFPFFRLYFFVFRSLYLCLCLFLFRSLSLSLSTHDTEHKPLREGGAHESLCRVCKRGMLVCGGFLDLQCYGSSVSHLALPHLLLF